MALYDYLSDALLDLMKKKAACRRCQALDAAIAELSPLVNQVPSAHRPSLIKHIVALLQRQDDPMTAADIIDALLATGYPIKTKTFSSTVYTALHRNRARGVLTRVEKKWGLGPKAPTR